MRTKITYPSSNSVTVEQDYWLTGERMATTYFVPHRGGYVRVRDEAGRHLQVCEGLNATGNTLEATPETLLAVIRRELRRTARENSRS